MTTSGPLQGIRIVDLSIALDGPVRVRLLADQGADVIKVERPGIGDIGRWVGASRSTASARCPRRATAASAASPSASTCPEAVATSCAARRRATSSCRTSARRASSGSASGTTTCAATDLVYVSISGFGAAGRTRTRARTTPSSRRTAASARARRTRDGRAARSSARCWPTRSPRSTRAQAITAALLARERGRGGQHVQLSMLDAVVSFLWVDAAGNEVLLDGDGSQPCELRRRFATVPLHRRLGRVHADRGRRLLRHVPGVRRRRVGRSPRRHDRRCATRTAT